MELKDITADNKLKSEQTTKYKEYSKELKLKCDELDTKLSQFKHQLVTTEKQFELTKKHLEQSTFDKNRLDLVVMKLEDEKLQLQT